MGGGLICTGLLTEKTVPLIFYLSPRRNSKAAYRFLVKIINNVKGWQAPGLSTQTRPLLMAARWRY